MMSDRRTLTYSACDAIAAAGRKPSISSVREWTLSTHGKKQGSDTDVQGDINAWFKELLALKQEKLVVSGLPDEVAALARAMWIKANESAAENMSTERAENNLLVSAAEAKERLADEKIAEANQRTEQVEHEFDVAREAIRRLEESLTEMRSTAAAIEERHAGQLLARDERITALTTDFARKEAEYASRITELDGVRKHALLQIDEARVESRHWKAEFDRVDIENKTSVVTYRQRSSALDAELAGVRGRLGAVEESLAASQQRCALLEAAASMAVRPANETTSAVSLKMRSGRLIKRR
ncbi:DNA-binding protein [Glaciimonas sp. GNP009]